MLTKTPFYFLRHGETDWNLSNRAQGQVDIALNAKGIQQAQNARRQVEALGIKTICVSPLQRARATAEILNADIRCDIRVIDNLKECCWGSQEGEVKGAWYDAWKQGGAFAGAELYGDFIKRALTGINEALEAPGPILIVAHGGIYWAIQQYAEIGANSDIPNCTPVHHQPPEQASQRWIARALGEALD